MDSLGTIRSKIGLGSNMPIEDLVDQLTEVQVGAKNEMLDAKEVEIGAKISSIGNLRNVLTDVQSEVAILKKDNLFKSREVSIIKDAAADTNTTYLNATVDGSAVASSYDIEIRQLAQASKYTSAEFASSSSTLGTGTLTIEVGAGQAASNSYYINIDSTNNTLSGIKNAINNKSNVTGVMASIITSDTGARIIIAAQNQGEKYNLGITVSDDDGNNIDASGLSQLTTTNMTETVAAKNAIVRLDGLTDDITLESNVAQNLIEGVTLNLRQAQVGLTHTIKISYDTASTANKIESFVEKFNELKELLNLQTQRDGLNGENGVFLGDATIRSFVSGLSRTLQHSVTDNTYSSLPLIGITSGYPNGLLEIDKDKLNNALTSDLDGVVKLFSDKDDGVAVALDSYIQDYNSFSGIFNTQLQAMADKLVTVSEDRLKLTEKEVRIRNDLTMEFSKLDAFLGQMEASSKQIIDRLESSMVDPKSSSKR